MRDVVCPLLCSIHNKSDTLNGSTEKFDECVLEKEVFLLL